MHVTGGSRRTLPPLQPKRFVESKKVWGGVPTNVGKGVHGTAESYTMTPHKFGNHCNSSAWYLHVGRLRLSRGVGRRDTYQTLAEEIRQH